MAEQGQMMQRTKFSGAERGKGANRFVDLLFCLFESSRDEPWRYRPKLGSSTLPSPSATQPPITPKSIARRRDSGPTR